MYLLPLFISTVAGAGYSRVNPWELGIDEVGQWAGFIDVPHGSLFYWLFEARECPETSPLVFWFNGGPGCSSLSGLLTENGPSKIRANLTLEKDFWSWNLFANVVYIDQPVGVGYSIVTTPVNTTVEAAEDFTSFYKTFFELYPQYLEHDVHFAGESYAGRYIPVFAEAVMKMDDSPKHLKSIMLGNALVDDLSYFGSNYDYFCKVEGGYPHVVNETICEIMKESTPQCLAELDECIQSNSGPGCSSFFMSSSCYNASLGLQVIDEKGLNTYNIAQDCEPSDSGLCYYDDDYVAEYFNLERVKTILGASPSVEYQVCNDDINLAFSSARDEQKQTQLNVTNLLNDGVEVLVYNGDKDPLVNWVGGRNWTRSLEWSGKEQFGAALDSPIPFIRDGVKWGEVSNYGNLTFVRIYNSGHMVPKDQPIAAAHMFDTWLYGPLDLYDPDCEN